MKDSSGFTDTSAIPDDDSFKTATDNLNAEFEKEGVVDSSESQFGVGEEGEQPEERKVVQQPIEPPIKRNGEQRRLKKQLAQQEQLLQYQQQVIDNMRQQVGDSQQQTIETAKHTLEVKRYTIKEKLQEAYKEAQQTDDFSKVAELQDLLSEVNAEYNELKRQKPVVDQEQFFQQPNYQAPQEEYENPAEVWTENNPWYNKHPRLKAEVDEIYDDWSAKLIANGREDLLHTYEFYEEIGNIVLDRHRMDGNKATAKRNNQFPEYGGASHLNGAYNGANNRYDEPLTLMEKELAHTMPTSKPMTNKQKEDLYRKMKTT